MGVKRVDDERFFPRYIAVSKAFSGKLRHAQSGAEVRAKVLDVSRDGLGILAEAKLEKGSVIELEVAEKTVAFNVVYSDEDLIFKGKFRSGLQRTGSTENLVSLFRSIGFLDEG